MKKKFGFTLAEVLITLGIIGVVAAMTMPILYTNIQKKTTVAKLQKAYSEIANAAKLAEDTSGGAMLTVSNEKGRERFEKYMAPHLKIDSSETVPNQKIYYSPNGNRETGLAIIRSSGKQYTLMSGTSILLGNGEVTGTANQNGSVSIGMIVDLNGYKNPPNRFGRDAFYFVINSEKGTNIHFSDDGEAGTVQRTREELKDGPSAYNYQCNKKGRGLWCGALIQKDGWKISKDYPW